MRKYTSSSREVIDIRVVVDFETDAKSNVMNNIVESIISHVLSCNFKLGNHCQSKKSYAYYVEFIAPDTSIGIKMVRMKFRVGKHKGSAETKATRRIIIKDIKVGKKEFQSPVKMIYEIDDMFTGLSKGNIDAVFEMLN